MGSAGCQVQRNYREQWSGVLNACANVSANIAEVMRPRDTKSYFFEQTLKEIHLHRTSFRVNHPSN